MVTTSKEMHSISSNNITKCYKGMALCPLALRRLFDNSIAEDGKIHCIYKLIDRTNGFEYWGKMNTYSFSKFRKYVGSGTLLRFFIQQKGIQNFEQHLEFFYESNAETEIKEREIVSHDYLENANTYNMAVGGKLHFTENKRVFHDIVDGGIFKCNEVALDRILKTWPRFAKGQSSTYTQQSHWMNGTLKGISDAAKVIKLERLNNEQYEEITVQVTQLIQYLNLGWNVKSTKLWIHKPDQQVYRRGDNWKQINSSTKNIMKYILKGFIAGRPPRMDGAIIDTNFRWRENNSKNKSLNSKAS